MWKMKFVLQIVGNKTYLCILHGGCTISTQSVIERDLEGVGCKGVDGFLSFWIEWPVMGSSSQVNELRIYYSAWDFFDS